MWKLKYTRKTSQSALGIMLEPGIRTQNGDAHSAIAMGSVTTCLRRLIRSIPRDKLEPIRVSSAWVSAGIQKVEQQ